MRSPCRRPILLLPVAAIAAAACAAGRDPVRVREVFDWIRPGMACAEVEAVLGQPVRRYGTVVAPRVGNDEAWYLPPPAIGPADSPWGPGAICVVYGADNRVVAKRINPQWRDPAAPPDQAQ